MKIAVSILLLLFFVFMFKAFYSRPIASTVPEFKITNLSDEKLWSLVNEWRIKNNFHSYTKSQNICKIAEIRLEEIRKNFSHEGFEAKRFCKQGCTLGENLAKVTGDEETTLNGWINSPLHLKNLKDPFTHSCIKTSGSFAIQIFGDY